MIENVAELLRSIQDREAEALQRKGIKHPTTTGDMYEGLTRDILIKATPSQPQLWVPTGFIRNEQGLLSRQIDAMITTAPGEPIPYTDSSIVDSSDVIAAIEVKKSLYSSQLNSAYQNLYSVKSMTDMRKLPVGLFERAFRSITRQPFPASDELDDLPPHVKGVYFALFRDWQLPARVIFGYDGFRTEDALRSAFVKYLEGHLNERGFGPASLPDLIVCGGFSLVKANGMPFYAGDPSEDDTWPVYFSTAHNPLLLLLELLYTRLTYLLGVGHEMLIDSHNIEAMSPLITAEAVVREGSLAWEYTALRGASSSTPLSVPWAPAEVTDVEFDVLHLMGEQAPLPATDSILVGRVQAEGKTVDEVATSLRRKGLATLHNGALHYLTDDCLTVAMPDGRLFAGENIAGQMAQWIARAVSNYN